MGHMIGSHVDDAMTGSVDARPTLAIDSDVGIGRF
jgi:hypothetical protein